MKNLFIAIAVVFFFATITNAEPLSDQAQYMYLAQKYQAESAMEFSTAAWMMQVNRYTGDQSWFVLSIDHVNRACELARRARLANSMVEITVELPVDAFALDEK